MNEMRVAILNAKCNLIIALIKLPSTINNFHCKCNSTILKFKRRFSCNAILVVIAAAIANETKTQLRRNYSIFNITK